MYGLKTIFLHEELLRTKCENVLKINDEIRTIVENMKYWVDTYGALGLAAPQVGESIRLFIVSQPEMVCINPTILRYYDGVVVNDEGCMSIPGMYVAVPRYRRICLHWYDLQGLEHKGVFSGEVARVIQHEMDHLDGLLIDRYEK